MQGSMKNIPAGGQLAIMGLVHFSFIPYVKEILEFSPSVRANSFSENLLTLADYKQLYWECRNLKADKCVTA